ncbi:MAG: RHS repeat-associated core domain-containing protein, partial [Stackebrandtia sp.]
TEHAYDPATGQLDSTTGPDGTVTDYTYNQRGELTNAGPASYTYNAAGRTTSTTRTDATTTFTYDGDGRRTRSTLDGATTQYLWEPRSHLLAAETSSDGPSTREYFYGLGPVAFTADGSNPYYYHTDTQGSVREVVGGTGNTHWKFEYEPFGVTRTSTHPGTGPETSLGWAGQYSDPTGQTHLRARQYDPTTGSFTSPDPAGATAISATYTYANSNPMTAGDPHGLWPDWGAVGDVLSEHAPTISTVAGLGAAAAMYIYPPAAPVLGAISVGFAGWNAYQVCNGTEKGSCPGAIVNTALATGIAAPGAAWVTKRFIMNRTLAANTGSRLAEASSSAFRAADNVGDFTVSAKHLPGAGGRWNKWAEGVDINGTIASSLRSDAATFLPNAGGAADSFIVRTNVGSVIGTKGQTYVKAVISNDGRIITAYPVK